MTIGIIGSGNIGGTLAGLLVGAGYRVFLSNSRGPESLVDLATELGPTALAATAAGAAAQSDLVIEAVPFGRLDELPKPELEGKILVSAANYYPGRDGAINLGGLTQSEYLQGLLPGTRVAKAFNTIHFEHLRTQGDVSKPPEERRVLPYAADDSDTAEAVRALIASLGFGPLYLGPLAAARGISETDGLLYNRDLTLAEAREELNNAR